MKRGLLLLLISLPCIAARGESFWPADPQQGSRSYYFSEKGNDNNNGTRLAPWQSLKKLQEAGTLQPGDSVLLERGSVFAGTLSIHGNGWRNRKIYVGAYGEGENPVISGSIGIKDWTRFKKNVWVAPCEPCDTPPADLYINGKAQSPGRYPNEGYLHIRGSFNSKTSFADETLESPDQYWNGAEIVVKSSRWTIDNLPVSDYRNKAFHFDQPASDILKQGFGYFIQRHFSTLDKNGEWYYDRETNQIFLYADADLSAQGAIIEVSIHDTGLKVFDSEFVTVEDLSVMNTRVLGVSVTRSNDVTLRQLQISNAGANGLVVIGCKNPTVANSVIRSSNNNGVIWGDNVNGLISNNAILRTGLYPGRGSGGNGTYIALSITGANPHAGSNVVNGNRIDSTGYSAIDFRVGHTTIKNNVISNFCLVKDDGGGIYTWGNPYGDNTIEGNIIVHGRGSGDGTPEPGQQYASGIYIDDRSANVSITGNTVAFCATAGIFIHNSNSIVIRRNGLYGNGDHLTNIEKGQLLIKRDAIVPLTSPAPLNLEVTENIFAAIGERNYCVYLKAEKKEDLDDPGVFNMNQYRAPKGGSIIARVYGANGLCNGPETFDLPQWQASTIQDTGSSFSPVTIVYPALREKNLIKNGALAEGTEGWFIWPDDASIVYEKNLLHGPSLKALVPEGGEALLYHPGFVLDDQRTYRLTFSVKGTTKSKLEFAPLAAASPWHALGDYTCFSIDTTYRTFTWFFKPEKSSSDARLNFKSNATFWIDHVSLHEAILPPEKANSLKLIYNTSPEPRNIPLKEKYLDMDGKPVPESVTLGSYDSRILFKKE